MGIITETKWKGKGFSVYLNDNLSKILPRPGEAAALCTAAYRPEPDTAQIPARYVPGCR